MTEPKILDELAIASNPEITPDQIEKLYIYYPLEIAGNPNLSALKMLKLVGYCRSKMNAENRKALAILWALHENPVLPVLRLEEPGHPVFHDLNSVFRRVRIHFLLDTMSAPAVGRAFIESVKLFLPLIHRYNKKHYHEWLVLISRLWQVHYGIVPYQSSGLEDEEFKIDDVGAHPFRACLNHIQLSLNKAIGNLYRDAFEELMFPPYFLFGTEDYFQAFMTNLELSEMGIQWECPAFDRLPKCITPRLRNGET